MKRFAALVLVGLSACKTEPSSTGALIFDPDLDVATEVEVLKSRPPPEGRCDVKRREGTTVVDVTAYAKDPREAARLCNTFLEQYLEARMVERVEAASSKLARLEELDAGAEAEVQRRELELLRQSSDVHVLERCELQQKR